MLAGWVTPMITTGAPYLSARHWRSGGWDATWHDGHQHRRLSSALRAGAFDRMHSQPVKVASPRVVVTFLHSPPCCGMVVPIEELYNALFIRRAEMSTIIVSPTM